MNRSKYKHLFFDLDHTLWDHDRNSEEALKDIFDRYELSKKGVSGEKFLSTYLKINRKCWKSYRQYKITKDELRIIRFQKTFSKFGLQITDNESIEISDLYISLMSAKKHLLPSTIEILYYLSSRYDLHVITNGFYEIQHRKLKNSDIRKYFKNIIISEQVGKLKPHPLVFQHALEKCFSTAELALMIGDNIESDIRGAQSAGIDQVFYNPAKHIHNESVTYEISDLIELKGFL